MAGRWNSQRGDEWWYSGGSAVYRGVIGEFHKVEFSANGADPSVFGGFKVDAMEKAINNVGGTTREFYDYRPSPSCKN